MSSCFGFKPNTSCVEKVFPCGKAPRFWSVNWAAALIHLVNGLGMLMLWSSSDNKDTVYRLTETYAPWTAPINGTCPLPSIQISDEWCLSRVVKPTSEVSLWWLIIGFHVLSFTFQTLAMVECHAVGKQNYVNEVRDQGTNTLRMLEYSVSATLMQIAIALLLGVWQRLTIIGIAFLTVVTMLLGLIAEQTRKIDIHTAWVAHIVGWISMAGVWIILGRQFVFTILESPNGPPKFVYAIVIVIGMLYSCFGFVQMYQLYKTNKVSDESKLNETVEVLYCVNSLVSKSFLGWMIFSNALVGVAQS